MSALLRASHPQPTAAVTVFTCVLALSAGRGWSTVWVGAAVLAGQLSVGWSNDWLDAQRDRAVGRTDKPVATGTVAGDVVRNAALAALAAAIGLSLLSGLAAAAVHLVAIGAAWTYNLGVKSTPASVVPYALAFALLPAFVTLGPPLATAPPWWAFAAGALLGAGAHFANVLPDLDADARVGVHGLPHRLGPLRSLAAATVLLTAGAAVVAFGPGRPTAVGAVGFAATVAVVLAVPITWRAGRRDGTFQLAMAAAGGVVVIFVANGSQLA